MIGAAEKLLAAGTHNSACSLLLRKRTAPEQRRCRDSTRFAVPHQRRTHREPAALGAKGALRYEITRMENSRTGLSRARHSAIHTCSTFSTTFAGFRCRKSLARRSTLNVAPSMAAAPTTSPILPKRKSCSDSWRSCETSEASPRRLPSCRTREVAATSRAQLSKFDGLPTTIVPHDDIPRSEGSVGNLSSSVLGASTSRTPPRSTSPKRNVRPVDIYARMAHNFSRRPEQRMSMALPLLVTERWGADRAARARIRIRGAREFDGKQSARQALSRQTLQSGCRRGITRRRGSG